MRWLVVRARVHEDVDEVERKPGEEGDDDDADEEEEGPLAPPVPVTASPAPERKLGQLQINPEHL